MPILTSKVDACLVATNFCLHVLSWKPLHLIALNAAHRYPSSRPHRTISWSTSCCRGHGNAPFRCAWHQRFRRCDCIDDSVCRGPFKRKICRRVTLWMCRALRRQERGLAIGLGCILPNAAVVATAVPGVADVNRSVAIASPSDHAPASRPSHAASANTGPRPAPWPPNPDRQPPPYPPQWSDEQQQGRSPRRRSEPGRRAVGPFALRPRQHLRPRSYPRVEAPVAQGHA